MPARKRAR